MSYDLASLLAYARSKQVASPSVDPLEVQGFLRRCLAKRCRLRQWSIQAEDRSDIVGDALASFYASSRTENWKRVAYSALRGALRDYWRSRIAERDTCPLPPGAAAPGRSEWSATERDVWNALSMLSSTQAETARRMLASPDYTHVEQAEICGLTERGWYYRVAALRRAMLPAYVYSVLSDCIDQARR
jgi:hypothetical protein